MGLHALAQMPQGALQSTGRLCMAGTAHKLSKAVLKTGDKRVLQGFSSTCSLLV